MTAPQSIRQAVAFRTWTRLLAMPDVGIYVEADPTVSGGIVVTAKPTGNRLINEIVARATAPDEQQPAEAAGDEQAQDGAAGRDEAAEKAEERYRNTRTHVLVALSEHCSFPHVGAAADAVTALVKPQLEAVYAAGLRTLAERNALAARVAELEAHLAQLLRVDREADEADTRAVAALLHAQADGAGMAECKHVFAELRTRFADRIAALDAKPGVVIGAGSPETSALTHCPTCGSPEWLDDGRRGWNPVDVECEVCAGTYAAETEES